MTTDLSPIMRALEAAYRMIQKRHPGTPNVTIVIQRDAGAWGHTTTTQVWHSRTGQAPADTADLYEVMVSGENLDRGAVEVAATLLHEAAHARNLAAGVRDVDVNGRHNRKFADAAEALGLRVTKNQGRGAYLGFTATYLDDDGQAQWAAMIARIQKGLDQAAVARHALPRGPMTITGVSVMPPPRTSPPKRTGRRTLLKAVCTCGHSLRISQTALDAARPTCQSCGDQFTAEGA